MKRLLDWIFKRHAYAIVYRCPETNCNGLVWDIVPKLPSLVVGVPITMIEFYGYTSYKKLKIKLNKFCMGKFGKGHREDCRYIGKGDIK